MADIGKTEKATEKKREDERKKGNIFHSRDLTNSLSLLAVVFVLKLIIPQLMMFIQKNISSALGSVNAVSELTIESAAQRFTDVILKSLAVIIPIGISCAVFAVVFGGLQTRFLFKTTRMKPKFSRMNPVSGIKRMFSLRSIVELLKSIVKVTIISSVVYLKIKSNFLSVVRTPFLSLNDSLSWIGNFIYDITISIAIYMAVFSVADYFYQWWEYEKDIRMTKQEVKDEYKQTEGDPQIKSRIKDVQRKLAAMRMMGRIPGADVVIRNPTKYAIAIKYNPLKNSAPVVVAKGKGYIAKKIIEIAEEHGVYITENKPLARGLYEAVELERAIPEEFYRPVADILAFIYKLKKSGKGSKQ